MKSLTKKKTKAWLISIGSALLITAMVLSGVGIYFRLNKKTQNQKLEVINPLDFSVDAWDGKTVSPENFITDFAGRGLQTRTIDSAASFIHFIDEVNDGETFDGVTVYLNTSIDLRGYEINSIGSQTPFKGTFDGGFYTIYNANIIGNGLFGNTENAKIKNLGLYKATITSDEEIIGGLVGKAVNTDVENSFVRLANFPNAKNVGGLVGEYVSTTGNHSISYSFVDTELNAGVVDALVYKVTTNSTSSNSVTISNSYYTQGLNATCLVDDADCLVLDKVIQPTRFGDFVSWSYSKKYSDVAKWCDYDYLPNSQQLDFNYPVQTGFVKTYLTGSYYESVVITDNGEVKDVKNLTDAFDVADDSAVANVNLLVEKIFMDARAEVVGNSQVTVNAAKDSTILRSESNDDSLFVVGGSSKLVIGNNTSTLNGEEAPTIILDGNKEYIENNNIDSGALVVANGGTLEIYDNVTLQNNVNNNVGYGGAVLLYGSANPILTCEIKNCSVEYSGGGICAVSTGLSKLGTVSNCYAGGNGGGIAIIDKIEQPAIVSKVRNLYGNGFNVELTKILPDEVETLETYFGNNNNAGQLGGALYIGGSTELEECYVAESVFENNTAAGGGAIAMLEGCTLGIENCEFTNNYAEGSYSVSGYSGGGDGGAIWSGDDDVDLRGEVTINGSYGVDGYGGAIYAPNNTVYISENAQVAIDGYNANLEEGGYNACEGGAIFADFVNVISGLEITGCVVSASGGAIYARSAFEMHGGDVWLSTNSADGYGGAIYSEWSIMLTGCNANIITNWAEYGGALAAQSILIDAENSNVTLGGNNAGTDGGAIYTNGDIYLKGPKTASDTNKILFQENTAESGAAIYIGGGVTEIIGYVVFDSNDGGNGAAIYACLNEGSPELYIGWSSFFDMGSTGTGRVQFTNNSVGGDGGALWLEGGVTAEIYYTDFANNISDANGGSIWNETSLELGEGVTFNGDSAACGGSIYNNGNLNGIGAEGFSISNSVACDYGGAIYSNYDLIIGGGTFTGNNATYGGAFYTGPNDCYISGGTFTGNNATNGGVVCTEDGGIIFDNEEAVTLSGNYATGSGGVVYTEAGLVTFANTAELTLSGNHATGSGGAVWSSEVYFENTATVTFSENYVSGTAEVYGGAISSTGVHFYNSGAVNFNGNYGTSTGNKKIYGGAVYLDYGVEFENTGKITFDGNHLTGYGMGVANASYGAAMYIYVEDDVTIQNVEFKNNYSDRSRTTLGYAYGALAIEATGAVTIGNNVIFTGNKYQNTPNATSFNINGTALYVKGATQLDFAGTNIVFDGNGNVDNLAKGSINGGATYSTVPINFLNGSNVEFKNNKAGGAIYATSTLDINSGATVAFNNNSSTGYGGAIHTTANVNIASGSTATFSGNSAKYSGGAIYQEGGGLSITIDGSASFTENSAQKGGAIYFDGYSSESSDLTINSAAVFSENSASQHGGAIYSRIFEETYAEKNTVTINGEAVFTSNSVTGTTTGYDGGAIYVTETDLILGANAKFSGNTSPTYGDAIYASYVTFNSDVTYSESNFIHLPSTGYITVGTDLSGNYKIHKNGATAFTGSNLSAYLWYDPNGYISDFTSRSPFFFGNISDGNYSYYVYSYDDYVEDYAVFIRTFEKPTLSQTVYSYRGTITPTNYNSTYMNITGNTASSWGNYTMQVTLKDYVKWRDETAKSASEQSVLSFDWSAQRPRLRLYDPVECGEGCDCPESCWISGTCPICGDHYHCQDNMATCCVEHTLLETVYVEPGTLDVYNDPIAGEKTRITIPTKPGYTFNGYERVAASRIDQFINASGQPIYDFYYVVEQAVEPYDIYWSSAYTEMRGYAMWTPAAYQVTFDANGGTVDTASKYVNYGSTYQSLPTPTKTGYNFAGWYGKNLFDVNGGLTSISDSYGARVENGQIIIPYSSGNSFASEFDQFIGVQNNKSYTISFNLVQGSSRILIRLYDANKELINDSSLTLAGGEYNQYYKGYYANTNQITYTFPERVKYIRICLCAMNYSADTETIYSNYQVEEGETATTYAPYVNYDRTVNEFVTTSTKVTTIGDHTLTAKWSPITYVVQFNAYGYTYLNGTYLDDLATDGTEDVLITNMQATLTYGHTYALPRSSFNEVCGTLDVYNDGTVIETLYTTHYTMYWEAERQYIDSDPTTGDFLSITTDYQISNISNLAFIQDSVMNVSWEGAYQETLLPTPPAKEHYTFVEWNTKSDGSGNGVPAGGYGSATSYYGIWDGEDAWYTMVYALEKIGIENPDISNSSHWDYAYVDYCTDYGTVISETFPSTYNTHFTIIPGQQTSYSITAGIDNGATAYYTRNQYTIEFEEKAGVQALSGLIVDFGEEGHIFVNALEGYYNPTLSVKSGTIDLLPTGVENTVSHYQFSGLASNVVLTATATVKSYYINFYHNGGSGGYYDYEYSVAYGSEFTVIDNPYTAPTYTVNYETNGGNTLSSSSGSFAFVNWKWYDNEYYNPGDKITIPATDSTMWAQWSASIMLPTPTRTGYNFVSWNTESDGTGTTVGRGGDSYSPAKNSNVTLYAIWSAGTDIPYTVYHYKENLGVSGTLTTSNCTLADTQSFTGTTGASVTPAVKTYTGFTSPSTQTVTILADGSRVVNYFYSRNSYSLTINVGTGISNVAFKGGSSSTTSITGSFEYEEVVNVNINIINGYCGEGLYYVSGTEAISSSNYEVKMGAGNVVYKAEASPDMIFITYEANGGSGSMSQDYVPFDGVIQLQANKFTKEGYKFAGWKPGSAEGQYGATSSLGNNVAASTVIPDRSYVKNLVAGGSATLTAQWTPITYIVEVSNNPWDVAVLEGAYLDDLSIPGSNDVPFVKVAGRDAVQATLQYDHEYILPWPSRSDLYYLDLDYYNDGTKVERIWHNTVIMNWYDAPNSTYPLDSIKNLEASEGAVKVLFPYTASYANLPTPTRTGYTFVAWNLSSDGSGENIVNYIDFNHNSTLYGIWDAKDYYLTLYGNGGWQGTQDIIDIPYDYDSNYTLSSDTFVRTYTVSYEYDDGRAGTTATANYVLSGWTEPVSGTAYGANATIKMSFEHYTLYAQWTPVSVTLPNPTRTGYTFAGWYDENATFIGNGGAAYTPTEEIILVAHWTANTSTITFNPNGGYNNIVSNHDFENVETATDLQWDTSLNGTMVPSKTDRDKTLNGTTNKGYWFLSGNPNTTVNYQYGYHGHIESDESGNHYYRFKTNEDYDNETYGVPTLRLQAAVYKLPLHLLVSGHTYALALDVKRVSGNGYVGAGIVTQATSTSKAEWFADSKLAGNPTTNDVWETISHTFTFTYSGDLYSAMVYIVGNISQGELHIDNVNFVDLTEATDASGTATYDSTYGELWSAYREGYEFTGWTLAQNGGTPITSNTYVTTVGNHTLYAQWKAKQYNLNLRFTIDGVDATAEQIEKFDLKATFEIDGTSHSVPPAYSEAVDYGTTYRLTGVGYDSNYFNISWDNSLKTVGTGTNEMLIELETIYYTLKFTYSSSYDASINSTDLILSATAGSWDVSTISRGQTATLRSVYSLDGVSITISASNSSYDYSLETGVDTNGDGKNDRWPSSVGTLNLGNTWKWTPNANKSLTIVVFQRFKVSAQAGSGVSSALVAHIWNSQPSAYVTSASPKQGSGVMLQAIVEKGHTFLGWYNGDELVVAAAACDSVVENADGTTTYTHQYLSYANPGNGGLRENLTLTAVAEANEYDVTFEANGGTVSPTSKTVTFGETYGDLPIPTKDGHTFLGWYGKNLLDIEDATITVSNSYYKNTITSYQLLTNTTYTLSFNYNVLSYDGVDVGVGLGYGSNSYSVDMTSAKTYPNNESGRFVYEFTTPSNFGTYTGTFAVRFVRFGSPSSASVEISNVQLEFGSTASDYEEFVSSTEITASSVVTDLSDHTLYARWSVNTYVASFNENYFDTTKVVGSPTINGTLVSGLSNENYIKTSAVTNGTAWFSNSSWELGLKIKAPTTTNAHHFVNTRGTGGQLGILIGASSAKIYFYVSSTGSAWTTSQTIICVPSTDYTWVKLSYSNGTLATYYSSDGFNYTAGPSVSDSPYTTTNDSLAIGRAWGDHYSGDTVVDMSDTYVKVNNSIVWGHDATNMAVTYGESYGTLPQLTRPGYNFLGWYGKNLVDIPNLTAATQETTIDCNITQTVVVSAQTYPTKIQNNQGADASVWRLKLDFKDGTSKYAMDANLKQLNSASLIFNATEENPIIHITYRGVYIREGSYSGIQIEAGTTATDYAPYVEYNRTSSDLMADGTTVQTAQDHVLHARWEKKPVLVTINNLNDWASELADDCSESGTYYIGDVITLNVNVLRDNITFYQWWKNKAVYSTSKLSTYTITAEDAEAGKEIVFKPYISYGWQMHAKTNFSTEDDSTGGYVSSQSQFNNVNYDNWSAISYNSGNTFNNQSTLTNAMFAQPKEGYYFYGWFLRTMPTKNNYVDNCIARASDCEFVESATYGNYYSYQYDLARINPADGKVGAGHFYALFLPLGYTVTLDANGGEFEDGSESITKEVVYNETYGDLPTPTRDGYTFSGWYGKNFINIDSMLISDSLVANDDGTYRLGYTSNGRFSATQSAYIPANTTFTLSYELVETNITKSNYPMCFVIKLEDGTSKYESFTKTYSKITQSYNSAVVSIRLYIQDTEPVGTYTTFRNLMIEIGGEVTDYEPFVSDGEVTLATTVGVAYSHTLHARWTPIDYTLTIANLPKSYLNEDEEYTIQTEFTYNIQTPLTLPVVEKDYCEVLWWQVYEDSGNWVADERYELGQTLSAGKWGDVQLNLKWEWDTYTVIFDNNGHGTETDSVEIKYNGKLGDVLDAIPTPTDPNYDFGGWFKKQNTTGSAIKLTTQVNAAAGFVTDTENKTFTVYAKWTLKKFGITFISDGQVGGEELTSRHSAVEVGASLTLPADIKRGYTLNGWYSSETGGTKYDDVFTMPNSNVTMYARWTKDTYTITFDPNSGEVNPTTQQVQYGDTLNMPTPTKTGYTADCWYYENYVETWDGVTRTAPSGSGTISDPYLIESGENLAYISYQLETNAAGVNNYTNAYFKQVKNINLDTNYFTPIGLDYNRGFRGTYDGNGYEIWNLWIEADTGSTFYGGLFGWVGTQNDYGTIANVTLVNTNIYVLAEYSTSKQLNLGPLVGTLQRGTVINCKAINSYIGYNDLGTDKEGNPCYANASLGGLIGKVTQKATIIDCYASGHFLRYTEDEAKVTEISNGGTQTNCSSNMFYMDEEWVKDSYDALLNVGYNYRSGEYQLVNGDAYPFSGDITLFTRWSQNDYTVEFNANGGTGSMESQTFKYDVAQKLTLNNNNITRMGWHFKSWNTAPDGTGTKILNGAEVINLTDQGTITLYAQWEINTATFKLGTNLVNVTGIYYGLTQASALAKENQLTEEGFVANANTNYYFYAELGTITGYSVVFTRWEVASSTGSCSLNGKTDNPVIYNFQSNGFTLEFGAIASASTANTYTVKFDANTGTGSMSDQVFLYDQAKNLSSNAYEKTGYTFASWNTKADGTGTTYTDGQEVINLVESGEITLYAQWNVNYHNLSVEFNVDGVVQSTAPSGLTINFKVGSTTSSGITSYNEKVAYGTSYQVTGYYSDGISFEGETVLNYTATYDESNKTMGTEDVVVTINVTSREVYFKLDSFMRLANNIDTTATFVDSSGKILDEIAVEGYGINYYYAKFNSEPITININFTLPSNHGRYDESIGAQYNIYDIKELPLTGSFLEGYSLTWDPSVYWASLTIQIDEMFTTYVEYTEGIEGAVGKTNGGKYVTSMELDPGQSNYIESVHADLKAGYKFKGWFVDSNNNGVYEDSELYGETPNSLDNNVDWTWGQDIRIVAVAEINTYSTTIKNSYKNVANDTKLKIEATNCYVNGVLNGSVEIGINESVTITHTYDAVNTYSIVISTTNTARNYLVQLNYNTGEYCSGGTNTNTYSWKATQNLGFSAIIHEYHSATVSAGTGISSVKFDTVWSGNDKLTNVTTSNRLFNTEQVTFTAVVEDGYTFDGWYNSANQKVSGLNPYTINITSDQILTAVASVNSYTVTFDYNYSGLEDTTKQVVYTSTYGDLPAPTREGYSFLGWYDTVVATDLTIPASTSGSSNSRAVKYNAVPGAVYQVSIDKASVTAGTASGFTIALCDYTAGRLLTQVTVGFGSNIVTTLSCPNVVSDDIKLIIYSGVVGSTAGVATSYQGIKVYESTTYKVEASTQVIRAEDHTLGAIWKRNTYTVKFNANGGTGSMGNMSCEYDLPYTLLTNAFTRTGYTFAGWNTEANGTGDSYSNNQANVANLATSGIVTLYAQWTANPYVVKYNANNGTGSMSDQEFTYGVAQNLKANTFTRTGYEFDGWNTASNGTGTKYTNGQSVNNLTTTVNGSVTLYAQWKVVTYTITYNLGGGTATGNPSTYTIETASFTLKNPTYSGYTFAGWSGTGIDGTSKSVTIAKGSTGNRTYTAVWLVDVTLNVVGAKGNAYSVTVIDAQGNEKVYTESFQVIKGQAYTFLVDSTLNANSGNNAYQIFRVSVDGAMKDPIASPIETSVADYSVLENATINDSVEIKFEYFDAYVLNINTEVGKIRGLSLTTKNKGSDIIIKQPVGNSYVVADGTTIEFSVDSTPASTTIYTFIGFEYIVNGVTQTVGVNGGNDIIYLSFAHNRDYDKDSDIGIYTYKIAEGVEISSLTIKVIASQSVSINTAAITSGQLVLTSEYGFNKVIDSHTDSVILYAGVWKIYSTNLTFKQLQEVFAGHTVTQDGSVTTVTIGSSVSSGGSMDFIS